MVIEFLDLNDPNLRPFDGVNFALNWLQESIKGSISTTAEWALSKDHKLSEPELAKLSLASGQERPRL